MLERGKVKQLLKLGPDNHHKTFVKITHRAADPLLGTSTEPRLTARKGGQKERPVLPTAHPAPSLPPGPSCPDNAVNRRKGANFAAQGARAAGQAGQKPAGLRWVPGAPSGGPSPALHR